MCELVTIYGGACGFPTRGALELLWELMLQRKPEQNISHKEMPTWDEHVSFVMTQPYEEWYMILWRGIGVGAVYITKNKEVGLFLLERWQGHGIGAKALAMLREKHPGPLLANIAPGNTTSQKFFENQGFKLIQYTYRG